MPSIIDLDTAGLQRSAHISGKPPNKSNILSCKTMMKFFCVYGIALASLWPPRESSLHYRAQNFVNTSVNEFQYEIKNFDKKLNALNPMELLLEKENK